MSFRTSKYASFYALQYLSTSDYGTIWT